MIKGIKKIPNLPGVYFFKNKQNEIIYIGKSGNLKKRISSYWQKENQSFYSQKMLAEVKKVDFKTCQSEFEALLWEAKLINLYQPKYNIKAKDDKSFLRIGISLEEKYPRVFSFRKKDLTPSLVFGPFPLAQEVREVLKITRQIFPYRSCRRLPSSACLYFHLNLCPGCCLGYSPYAYQKTIKKIINFLNGDIKKVVANLKKEMFTASKNLEFEKAQEIKQKIEAIKRVVLNWQSLSKDNFSFWLPKDEETVVTKEIKKILPKIRKLIRIEAYDISVLYGQEASGAMVVFENFLPQKDKYRRFKIKFSLQVDDLKMIKEVLKRRLRHTEWEYPQLILIDGGKGQVGAVFEILCQFNLEEKIFILGLAKKQEIVFKPLIKKQSIAGWEEIKLTKDNLLLHLLQNLRDEAHRFAKKYHLLLRKKKLL